ncbi:MAG: hypothetical protein Q9173_003989 [Seirophora scorigena]
MSYPPGLLQAGGFWAGIFAIPLAVTLFFYSLRHWGWWKLHRQGNRRPLVRTWHGWVESKDDGNKRERNRLRKAPLRVLPRTARTDYSWVFWDPTGERQRRFEQERRDTFLRYLPRWMRSSPFGAADPNSDVDYDVEASRSSGLPESDYASASEGLGTLPLLGRHWRQDCRKVRREATSSHDYEPTPNHCPERPSTCTFPAFEGSSDDTVSTVRLRKINRQAWSGWQTHSEDIERATKTQLFGPTASFTLASLFRKSSEQKETDLERHEILEMTVAQGQQRSSASSPQPCRSPSLWHDVASKQPRNITVIGSPYRLLQRTQSQRDLNKAFRGNINAVRASCPLLERTQPWEQGAVDPSSRSGSPQPADGEGGSPTQGFAVGWPIRNPKKRGRMRSIDDSTAAAERMSMIDVPRALGTGVNEYEGGNEEDDDLGDVGDEVNICSPSSSRFGSLL